MRTFWTYKYKCLKNSLTIFICPKQSFLPGVQRDEVPWSWQHLELIRINFWRILLLLFWRIHNFKHSTHTCINVGYARQLLNGGCPPRWLRGYMHGLTWRPRPFSWNDKNGLGNSPGNFVESCIAALEFQNIFGEQKQTSPSPKTKVRGITPGESFEFCIVVGEF